MRDGRVFNWRGGIVVVIFLGFIFYPFRDLFTVYENFQEKIRVNDRLTLYITQVEASYLSKEFMSHVSDINPFMVTNDAKASATVTNGEIYLRVQGNIYAFTAAGFDVPIHLDRSAN